MLLKDKTIIISGVGPGMGQALARIAANEGARVVLSARNRDFLEEVRASIEVAGGQARVVPCDIADPEQSEALARAAGEYGDGRLHGLVNSAYVHGEWSGVENADADDFARTFDVNCLGALRLTRACVPYLKGGGAVVNVSAMAAMLPFGTEHGMEMAYATSKGAMNTLSKYMAADLGRHGIRVNTCRMGWIHGAPVQEYIDSQVAAGRSEEDVLGEITRDIPMGVIPPEDDCARAVLVLLSDYTRVVSGASLDVNGGHWMAP